MLPGLPVMTARRSLTFAALAATALLALLPAPRLAAAQAPLPDVDLTLVMEVRDIPGWRAFHTEVLGTHEQGQKGLDVAIDTGNGGSRALTVPKPKFEVVLVKGAPAFRVVVRGKLSGVQAFREVGAFEEALAESHGRPGEAVVGLYYGLSSVGAQLIELYVARP